MNVKAHIRATKDAQNNQTDGGALCDAPCSASFLRYPEWSSSRYPEWLCHYDNPDYVKGRWAAENMTEEERQEQLAKHTS